jgi:hypothetical protein
MIQIYTKDLSVYVTKCSKILYKDISPTNTNPNLNLHLKVVVPTPGTAPPLPKKESSPDVAAVVEPLAVSFSLEAFTALVEPLATSFSLEASAMRARMSNGAATTAGAAPGARAGVSEDISRGQQEKTFPAFWNS